FRLLARRAGRAARPGAPRPVGRGLDAVRLARRGGRPGRPRGTAGRARRRGGQPGPGRARPLLDGRGARPDGDLLRRAAVGRGARPPAAVWFGTVVPGLLRAWFGQ